MTLPSPAPSPTRTTVEANGIRFTCLEEGSGPLVLLLHGFPDTAHGWDDLRPRLAAAGYRALSPFMRGYRPTVAVDGKPVRDADIETLARDVLALIDALGSGPAIVVGHDWGALAAYGAAGLGPEKIRLLVTLAIPHPVSVTPTPATVWKLRHFIAYKLPGAEGRFARDDFAALPEICNRWSPKWHPTVEELAPVRDCFSDPASLHAAFGYYRALSPIVPGWMKAPISVPTVVFAGDDDPFPPESFRSASKAFTGGYDVEAMPGGHFMHHEHPAEFAARLIPRLPR